MVLPVLHGSSDKSAQLLYNPSHRKERSKHAEPSAHSNSLSAQRDTVEGNRNCVLGLIIFIYYNIGNLHRWLPNS